MGENEKKEATLRRKRIWAFNNPEKVKAASAKWRAANPDKVKACAQAYRESGRKREVEGIRRSLRATAYALAALRWEQNNGT